MATPDPRRTFVIFALGEDHYLVPAEQVRELVPVAPLTPLPGAPPWVRGVFNLRGAVVPLVDLGLKLGVASPTASPRTSWIVGELHVERRRELFAFEIDEMLDILEIGGALLLAVPAAGIRVERRHLLGVVARGSRFGLVLDLASALLAPAAAAAVEAAP